MTTLATESWTGTNGAAWPAQWTSVAGNTIQTNRGRMAAGGGYGAQQAYLSTMTATSDTETLITVLPPSSGEWYATIAARTTAITASSNAGFPNNGVATQLKSPSSAGTTPSQIEISRIVSGTRTQLSSTNITLSADASGYKVRFRLQGAAYSVKVWGASSAEPASWTATITDGTPYTTAGRTWLGAQSGAAATAVNIDYDDLTTTDSAAFAVAANLSGSGTLSATAVPLGTVSASLTGSGTLSATATPKATASVSVSGSGTLTATTVHVATAALSGSGTLTANFGALNVNASLTGSGTLTASVSSIAVNANASGSGTLTATTAVTGAYSVALSGSGQLAATTTPRLTLSCRLGGDGALTVTTSYRVFAWLFRTPTQDVWFPIAGRGLVGTYEQGLSVYRVGGQWRTRISPGPDELAAADRIFQGGYLHRLSDADRADLVAAGFADNITYEEVMA